MLARPARVFSGFCKEVAFEASARSKWPSFVFPNVLGLSADPENAKMNCLKRSELENLEPRPRLEPGTWKLLQRIYVIDSSISFLRLAARFCMACAPYCSHSLPKAAVVS